MSDPTELAIVIPVRNRRAFTRACLAALRAQTWRDFEVIVIDDGSTDGTPEMIGEEFPEATLLRGDGNLWWTRATNLGVEHALGRGARRIMTLNDDTVPPPDFIENMIRWSEREPRALLGALAIDLATGRPVYGGERIRWLTAGFTRLLDELDPSQWRGLHEVTHYPGRGLLIPAAVFADIGLFEASAFPQTIADHDFTHRARRAGYGIYCNYDARLGIHPEESGDVQMRKHKSFRNYYQQLFGIKGGANVPRFVRFAWRNCPLPYLVPCIVIGTLRRALGYPRDWLLEAILGKRRARPSPRPLARHGSGRP